MFRLPIGIKVKLVLHCWVPLSIAKADCWLKTALSTTLVSGFTYHRQSFGRGSALDLIMFDPGWDKEVFCMLRGRPPPHHHRLAPLGLQWWVLLRIQTSLRASTVKRDFTLRILSVSSEAELLSGSFLQGQNEQQAFLARYLFPVRIHSLNLELGLILCFLPSSLWSLFFLYLLLPDPQKLSSLCYETPLLNSCWCPAPSRLCPVLLLTGWYQEWFGT